MIVTPARSRPRRSWRMLTASLPLLFVLAGCVAVVPVPIGAFASGQIPAANFRQPPAGLAGNLPSVTTQAAHQ